MWKKKSNTGRKKKREKKTHTEGGGEEQALNLSFICKRKMGNFKTHAQYNNLFDET